MTDKGGMGTDHDSASAATTAQSPTPPPPGWYPDPQESNQRRWWDGTSWTEHVEQQGRLSEESRALRLILLVLVGAALTFGAIKLADSTDKTTNDLYGPSSRSDCTSTTQIGC